MEPADRRSTEMACDRPVNDIYRLMELCRACGLSALSRAYTHVYDVVLLCLRLPTVDSSILGENCCKWDLSKDCKDSINTKSPYVIST